MKCATNWIVRNRIEPGLRILDIDEIAQQNSGLTTRSNLGAQLCTVSADDSFRFCYRPFDLPPMYKDIYPWGEKGPYGRDSGFHVWSFDLILYVFKYKYFVWIKICSNYKHQYQYYKLMYNQACLKTAVGSYFSLKFLIITQNNLVKQEEFVKL